MILRKLSDGRWQVQRGSDGKPFGPPMTKEQAQKFFGKLCRCKLLSPPPFKEAPERLYWG